MNKKNVMIATSQLIVCVAIISLGLTACSTSPPVRYFSLSSPVLDGRKDFNEAVVLGLGPMRMAEYLNRSQIVTRGAGAEVKVDEFNRWAEPLAVAFHRVVSTDIDNMMDGVSVLAFPWESAVRSQVNYRLLGDVVRFDADRSGRVVLETQWGITETDSGKAVVKPRRTRYETQAGSPDDPAAVASAMNETLVKFSRDVVSEIQAVLQE
ncbi:MAG: hypothetical protein NMNS01_30020 [Nitrosomonas sp.]|nr:MAG: hypothetical protein NMNS01_30020 [Nitrosomonas sp.]